MPSHELIASWNDSVIDSPMRENEAFGRLVGAADGSAMETQARP
jgi:hypothetical protein